MNRVISIILAVSLIFSLASPAFASEVQGPETSDTVTIFLDGEYVTVNYTVEDDHIVYAEIGDDVMSVQGDEIFFNGTKVATITTTETFCAAPQAIEPRTSWLYTDTCPTGATSSDYSTLFSTKSHNITFEKMVGECSASLILSILVTFFTCKTEAVGKAIFKKIATAIDNFADEYTSFADSDKVYATEKIYTGGIPYTRKNIFYFYCDSAKTNFIKSTTCYSSWS